MFKAMAAVGYCSKKQIICFPWMSKQRFEYYHENLSDLIDTLEKLEMVTILPIGK
jgi:hypothetical protein